MNPTARLRFVERGVPAPEYGEGVGKTIRILQQWWESYGGGTISLGFGGEMPLGKVVGEWRDVPLEKEE